MSQTQWIRDKWTNYGCTNTYRIKKHLLSKKSKFQKIDVYDGYEVGRILMLDDIVMLTESDEFSYHEMITHPAMNTHPKPEKILVVGGGDGGTIRELLKYKSVKKIDVCEIDSEVVSVSKKYFPKISKGLDDKKVEIFYEDAAKFIKEKASEYDIIISDSSDPIGPGKVLFQKKFYENINKSLKDDGIAVTQSEGMFFDKKIISKLFSFNRHIFKILLYYYTLIPTYPSGTIGFSFCSKKYHPIKNHFPRNIPDLKYYNPEIHQAAFKLPNFMNDVMSNNLK